MTNGVCTYALYQSISNDAWSVQKKLAEAEEQESTGLKGTDYGTYGSSSGQLMTLQNAVNKLNTWNTNTKTAASRTSSMYTAISNIITEMTTLKTSISSAISGTDTTTTLNDTASGILDDVVDQLNTKLSGVYLFSGTATDTAPVDESSVSSSGGTSYYQGNSTKASVQISSDTSVTYGVTADNSAFSDALAVIATVNSSSVTSSELSTAYDSATTAITKLSELLASVSNTATRLSTAQTNQSSAIDSTTTLLSSTRDADVTQAKLNATNYETQLEASYSALASIFKLSLTSYL